MRPGAKYTLAVLAVAMLVSWVGALVPSASRTGVWVGAGVALATQVVVFWAMFEWLFPGRRVLAHGLGMLGRMAVFGLLALLALGWPVDRAASALFALVAVFFVSTVLEPLFLRSEPLKRS